MKCEICGNDYPSKYYFKTETICSECLEKLPAEEFQKRIVERLPSPSVGRRDAIAENYYSKLVGLVEEKNKHDRSLASLEGLKSKGEVTEEQYLRLKVEYEGSVENAKAQIEGVKRNLGDESVRLKVQKLKLEEELKDLIVGIKAAEVVPRESELKMTALKKKLAECARKIRDLEVLAETETLRTGAQVLSEKAEEMIGSEVQLHKKCPYCGEEILSTAVKCRFCGEWLTKKYSNKQPIRNFILLYVLTFGIYAIYWFYRNWKHIKAHKSLQISPGWRTVGLFVPFANIGFVYQQFRDVKNLATEVRCEAKYSPGGRTFGLLVLSVLWRLPGPFAFLGLLSVWPLVTVQHCLNCYWEKEQSGLPERTKFSGWEVLLLVVGGILLLLAFIGTLLPEQ